MPVQQYAFKLTIIESFNCKQDMALLMNCWICWFAWHFGGWSWWARRV